MCSSALHAFLVDEDRWGVLLVTFVKHERVLGYIILLCAACLGMESTGTGFVVVAAMGW